jgi:hypothetical protein
LPNVTIVSGGPSLTRENQDSIITSLAFSDYLIEGEGETAIVEFIKCLERKGDFSLIKQIWKLDNKGKPQYTGHGTQQNIDEIPYPDFSDFDRRLYPSPEKLPFLFSRGCILNCNYCENKWNHITQRSRTGENVFEELKHQVDKYNIKEYMFNDDSLISSKTMRQMEEYTDLVLAEGLVMPWSVYGTRVERLITESFVKKLRSSGMERVSLGVESFSSRVQKEMGKSSRYDDADRMCRMFANEGIKTESWIIYGYPTETDADFEETLNWFINNPNVLSHATVNAFGPNPKYMQDKPGVVINNTAVLWGWSGLESTLPKRKKRFLQLIDALESIRVARKGQFSYYFGDPLYVKYFKSWTQKDKEFLLQRWEELQATHDNGKLRTEQNGKFGKIFSRFGFNSIDNTLKKIAEQNAPPLILELKELAELKEELSKKMDIVLQKTYHYNQVEIEAKKAFYFNFLNETKLHLNDGITEEILYGLTLQSDLEKVFDEFETHAPEYIAQKVVTHANRFIIKKAEIS